MEYFNDGRPEVWENAYHHFSLTVSRTCNDLCVNKLGMREARVGQALTFTPLDLIHLGK